MRRWMWTKWLLSSWRSWIGKGLERGKRKRMMEGESAFTSILKTDVFPKKWSSVSLSSLRCRDDNWAGFPVLDGRPNSRKLHYKLTCSTGGETMELFVRLLVGNYKAIKKKKQPKKDHTWASSSPCCRGILVSPPGRQAGQVSGCRGRANLLRVWLLTSEISLPWNHTMLPWVWWGDFYSLTNVWTIVISSYLYNSVTLYSYVI